MVNILIVTEDNVLLSVLLESLGLHIPNARVDSQQIAASVINQIQSRKYHIILIDTHMPSMDSLASLSEILDLQPNASIIFVAELEERELIIKSLQSGAYDFITKPIDQQYFIAMLKRATERIQLSELNRLKDELLAGIPHELRNPLNSIFSWTQLMRTDKLDESTCRRAIEMIEQGIKEQAKLLERIGDLPRAMTAGLQIPSDPIERNALVKQLLDDWPS